MDSDQAAKGAACSESTMFDQKAYKTFQHKTKADNFYCDLLIG